MAKMLKNYKGQLVEYEIYNLVDYYDPILRQPTVPFKFENIEDNKRAHYMAFSMAETLGALEGLGLSANQVGLNQRVCAINMGSEIWTMFNPQIVTHSMIPADYLEGCLSYPGLYLKVLRWNSVTIKFQAINGEWIEQEFSGMTAVCIQHELDHLDGILYSDKVSSIKLEQAKRKVKKNVKRIKAFSAQKAAAESQAQKEIVYAKQKMKPIKSDDAPQITIMDGSSPISATENSPEVFVYRG